MNLFWIKYKFDSPSQSFPKYIDKKIIIKGHLEYLNVTLEPW